MNKKQKKELKQNIMDEAYIDQNNEMIFKKLVYNPLLRLLGMLILLIFSLLNNQRIMRLAALTSSAIFSNEYVMGHVTYYVILGITMGGCLLISLGALIVKSNLDFSSIVVLRRAYHFYSIYDMVVFVCSTFVCLFFIIMILLTPCNISGGSMENTYHDGDRVFLWNIGYRANNGDVIVFDSAKYTSYHSENSRFYIKRVIAKEGDIIVFKGVNPYSSGDLFVNDVKVATLKAGEYLSKIRNYGIIQNLELENQMRFNMPENKVLVMGDNRGNSSDSRSFGLIDESEIIGKVLFRFYPFDKIGNPSPEIQ